jgi:hypothetical protein
MRRTLVTGLLPLVVVLASSGVVACQSTPAATPTASRSVVYSQDFSQGPGTFEVFDFDTVAAEHRDGAFRLVFTEAGSITTAPAGQNLGDVSVEVDATETGPTAARRYGLFCRLPEEGIYYEFSIDSSGQVGTRVAAHLTQSGQPLVMAPNAAVRTGLGVVNHLRADCVGPTFTFWVNDTIVGSFADTTTATGDVGLFASSASDERTEVSFDNFVVYQP